MLLSNYWCLTGINFCLAADVLYDLGSGLEVLSPLCPHLFFEMAGLGNFAKVDVYVHTKILIFYMRTCTNTYDGPLPCPHLHLLFLKVLLC